MKRLERFAMLIFMFCMVFLCSATVSQAKSKGFVKKSGKYYYYEGKKRQRG